MPPMQISTNMCGESSSPAERPIRKTQRCITAWRHMKAITGILGICLGACNLVAQAPATEASADVRARVSAIVSKMTMEEKIDYIGGTGFAVRAMPKLHLPSFEMSDGPYGVRSNSGFPSTTYGVGIGLAASG